MLHARSVPRPIRINVGRSSIPASSEISMLRTVQAATAVTILCDISNPILRKGQAHPLGCPTAYKILAYQNSSLRNALDMSKE